MNEGTRYKENQQSKTSYPWSQTTPGATSHPPSDRGARTVSSARP